MSSLRVAVLSVNLMPIHARPLFPVVLAAHGRRDPCRPPSSESAPIERSVEDHSPFIRGENDNESVEIWFPFWSFRAVTGVLVALLGLILGPRTRRRRRLSMAAKAPSSSSDSMTTIKRTL